MFIDRKSRILSCNTVVLRTHGTPHDNNHNNNVSFLPCDSIYIVLTNRVSYWLLTLSSHLPLHNFSPPPASAARLWRVREQHANWFPPPSFPGVIEQIIIIHRTQQFSLLFTQVLLKWTFLYSIQLESRAQTYER